ncbi:hypothetical protein DL95DRAFT_148861 [Leptodontidium sp. 2 PMI_412]|nr:hypothetical protein DL95DRAFT_148861 [Leptodontidium sp. 2 PMI_412]
MRNIQTPLCTSHVQTQENPNRICTTTYCQAEIPLAACHIPASCLSARNSDHGTWAGTLCRSCGLISRYTSGIGVYLYPRHLSQLGRDRCHWKTLIGELDDAHESSESRVSSFGWPAGRSGDKVYFINGWGFVYDVSMSLPLGVYVIEDGA